jgi:hypothetical protein
MVYPNYKIRYRNVFKGEVIMKTIVLGASHGGIEAVEALRMMCPEVNVQWYDKGRLLLHFGQGS